MTDLPHRAAICANRACICLFATVFSVVSTQPPPGEVILVTWTHQLVLQEGQRHCSLGCSKVSLVWLSARPAPKGNGMWWWEGPYGGDKVRPTPDIRTGSDQEGDKQTPVQCASDPDLKADFEQGATESPAHRNQVLQGQPALGCGRTWSAGLCTGSLPRESYAGGWRASHRLTLQMVATQMLPRFRGSMASSFIPSSNQPPSV